MLSILGKTIEKILLNSIFEYLQENNSFCEDESGFQLSGSCESQLLSIVHKTFASFDCNPPLDVRAVFSDISKAFDRVWQQKGPMYEIKYIGITGLPLKLIQSFLNNRLQNVVLNGQSSAWTPMNLSFLLSMTSMYLLT